MDLFPQSELGEGQLRRDWLQKYAHQYVQHDLRLENDFTYELTSHTFEKKSREMNNLKVKVNGIAHPPRMKYLQKAIISQRSARGALGTLSFSLDVHCLSIHQIFYTSSIFSLHSLNSCRSTVCETTSTAIHVLLNNVTLSRLINKITSGVRWSVMTIHIRIRTPSTGTALRMRDRHYGHLM